MSSSSEMCLPNVGVRLFSSHPAHNRPMYPSDQVVLLSTNEPVQWDNQYKMVVNYSDMTRLRPSVFVPRVYKLSHTFHYTTVASTVSYASANHFKLIRVDLMKINNCQQYLGPNTVRVQLYWYTLLLLWSPLHVNNKFCLFCWILP